MKRRSQRAACASVALAGPRGVMVGAAVLLALCTLLHPLHTSSSKKRDGFFSGVTVQAAPITRLQNRTLFPQKYTPVSIKSITPRGWLATQLKIQADGLSGHLADFWPDIMDSQWIGGTADGGLNERTPYWLNGVVPLAKLLTNVEKDEHEQLHHRVFNTLSSKTKKGASEGTGSSHTSASSSASSAAAANSPNCTQGFDFYGYDIANIAVSGVDECYTACVNTTGCVAFVLGTCTAANCTCATNNCWLKYGVSAAPQDNACRCSGLVPFKNSSSTLMEQVDSYITYILDHQAADGWFGPDDDPTGTMYWSKVLMLMTLNSYIDFHPEKAEQIVGQIMQYLQQMSSRMDKMAMSSWAAARAFGYGTVIQWLLDNYPSYVQEDFLFKLMDKTKSQCWDWETWFESFTTGANNHGVNNAQALKSAAVWYRLTGNETYYHSALQRLQNMDETYGLASGVYCADELLCDPPQQKMPSRGTELCAVVETMFSYNMLFAQFGDVAFADRAERVAYNALPATWASPKGGDMWNHQYLQALNEISAAISDPHIWTHDGDDAELYGLAPNYGCCTANFNQGWPKYAQYLIFSTSDGGAAIGAYAPVKAELPSGMVVEVDTNYPFEDVVRVYVSSNVSPGLPLYLRIPHWAVNATVSVHGGPEQATVAGTMFKAILPAISATVVLNLNPTIRAEHWFSNDTLTIHRGALMYSLPVSPQYTSLTTYSFESRDYQLLPTTEWRYALVLDPSNVSPYFAFNNTGYSSGSAPFNHTSYPSTITVNARVVPFWALDSNSAAAPPASPACSTTQKRADMVGKQPSDSSREEVKSHASACGAMHTITLVPYGMTELRISEFPWA